MQCYTYQQCICGNRNDAEFEQAPISLQPKISCGLIEFKLGEVHP